jgi:predicted RNA polymerase sigma factor
MAQRLARANGKIRDARIPHQLFHAVRADLLRRVGRNAEAARAYAAAIARTDNARERDSCSAAVSRSAEPDEAAIAGPPIAYGACDR